MEGTPRKRGRPRIPVIKDVLEARRLAKQRSNARSIEGNTSSGPSMAMAGDVASLPITIRRRGGGTNPILSSGDATKSYFNSDYEPVRQFMDRMLASGQTPASLLPPSQKRFDSTEENTIT